MGTTAWVVLIVVGLSILGFVVWLLLDDSIVRIPSARSGLLLIQGRPTARRSRRDVTSSPRSVNDRSRSIRRWSSLIAPARCDSR